MKIVMTCSLLIDAAASHSSCINQPSPQPVRLYRIRRSNITSEAQSNVDVSIFWPRPDRSTGDLPVCQDQRLISVMQYGVLRTVDSINARHFPE